MRKGGREVHGDAATERKANDAEGLAAPGKRRGGSRKEQLQGEQAAIVRHEGSGSVPTTPEVYSNTTVNKNPERAKTAC